MDNYDNAPMYAEDDWFYTESVAEGKMYLNYAERMKDRYGLDWETWFELQKMAY